MVAPAPPRPPPSPTQLEALAEHCLAASELIDGRADPVMRVAIDILLAEIGRALARTIQSPASQSPASQTPDRAGG